MKVIESEAARKTFDSIIDTVNRNKNNQMYIDAGGNAAVLLALIRGYVQGIENCISLMNESDQLSLKGTYAHLRKAKDEAYVILKNI
jgi:hypothetical protein